MSRAGRPPAPPPLALVALLAAILACSALPEPARHVRVAGASPEGDGVAPELAEAAVWFTAPVSPDALAGRRIVLVPELALPGALDAVDSEAGAAELSAAVPAELRLDDGGARAVLRLAAPLHARTPYVLVVSSRLHAADGGAVLDAAGRQRPSVFPFRTGDAAGPPPAPVLTEVRARAASPEAGGEYVELWNAGAGPLELGGWRLGKRTSAGGVVSCVMTDGTLPPGGVALVTGGAWDGRYRVPAAALRVSCGTTALAGGLADDRPVELVLLDPEGAVAATFGAGGVAPVCPAAVVKRDPAGPDDAGNLGCAEGEGTPGWL